ncbi:MAG: hypothetical protein CL732_08000 [Chloroflexi bacterium]|nr:hypothetical protein [Chloroflexota bacterium]
MASPKQTYEIELTPDQMAFMRSMKDKFQISNDSKTFRVVIDYLIGTRSAHEEVFNKRRCYRCD